MSKRKSAPLQSKQAVVKSTKLPALKRKGEWSEFDAYVEAARVLDRLTDAIVNHKEGYPTGLLPSVARLQASYDEFDRYWKMFERDELYRQRKQRWVKRPNGGYYTEREITRRVVLEKIGLLIGSFPNATPHSIEVYVGMLAEEIIAADPSVSGLEATFREIRRSKTFLPTIAEVLKEFYQQEAFWQPILEIGQCDVDYWIKQRAKFEEAYQARLAKEAEDKRLAEERQREVRERWERERKEREAREQAERERQRRDEAEERIWWRVRAMARYAESRFLWRWFYLLMLSRGIVMAYEQLRNLRHQYEQEDLVRKLAKLDPSKRKAEAERMLVVLNGAIAKGASMTPELAALKREYEDEINGETHKLNGSGSGRA
jgi:hypothetical protein